MAHLVGKEHLLSWYKLQNLGTKKDKPHWVIYANDAQKGQKGRWAESPEIEGYTHDRGAGDLEKAIDLMSHGVKYIVRSKIDHDKPDHSETLYLHHDPNQLLMRNGYSSVNGIGSTSSPGITPEQLEAKIKESSAKAIEDYKKEQEIKEMRAQLKELQNEKPNFLEKAIGTIMTNPQIMNKLGLGEMFNTNQPMQNQTQNPTVGATESNIDEGQARMLAALEKLQNADPDFVSLLEKVAKIAAEEPGKYNMYKPMIMA